MPCLPDEWEPKDFITHSGAVTHSKTFIVSPGQRATIEGHGFNSLRCSRQKKSLGLPAPKDNLTIFPFFVWLCVLVCAVKTSPELWKQRWSARIATDTCPASMTSSSAWWRKETPSCCRKVMHGHLNRLCWQFAN